jgi:hypothetical protein
MSSVAANLELGAPWRTAVGETNGAALLDIFRVITRGGVGVRVGVQFQNFRIKVFADPVAGKRAGTEAKNNRDGALDELRATFGFTRGPTTGDIFRSYPYEVDPPLASHDAGAWAARIAPVLTKLSNVESNRD